MDLCLPLLQKKEEGLRAQSLTPSWPKGPRTVGLKSQRLQTRAAKMKESLTFRINRPMSPGIQPSQLKSLLSGDARKPQTPEFWSREGARLPP